MTSTAETSSLLETVVRCSNHVTHTFLCLKKLDNIHTTEMLLRLSETCISLLRINPHICSFCLYLVASLSTKIISLTNFTLLGSSSFREKPSFRTPSLIQSITYYPCTITTMSDNPNVAMAEYRYPTSYAQILASILELPYFNSPLALWLNLLMASYLVGSVAYHWFHRSSLSLQVDEKSSKKGTNDGKEASTEMKENIINQEESSNGFANQCRTPALVSEARRMRSTTTPATIYRTPTMTSESGQPSSTTAASTTNCRTAASIPEARQTRPAHSSAARPRTGFSLN
jgi:hypothetical protein